MATETTPQIDAHQIPLSVRMVPAIDGKSLEEDLLKKGSRLATKYWCGLASMGERIRYLACRRKCYDAKRVVLVKALNKGTRCMFR
jgi:hypothetical protein